MSAPRCSSSSFICRSAGREREREHAPNASPPRTSILAFPFAVLSPSQRFLCIASTSIPPSLASPRQIHDRRNDSRPDELAEANDTYTAIRARSLRQTSRQRTRMK
ncbi:hypothetical protein B0H13DRAFT_2656894 [Mycena leptocephala]|nr:hypothetical protein B0H13DRAFT_2656894 [Mycena leptocephala]